MRGPLSSRLPWAGIVGNGVVITKDALLLRCFKVDPIDLGFASNSDIENVLRRLNEVFRLMNDDWFVWVDLRRRQSSEPPIWTDKDSPSAVKDFEEERRTSVGVLYHSEFFICFGKDVSRGKKVKDLLFGGSKGASKDDDKRNARSLMKSVRDFVSDTDDIALRFGNVFGFSKTLSSDEMVTYLHSTVGDMHPVKAPDYGFYIDDLLADERGISDGPLRIGSREEDLEWVQIGSVHDWPSMTHAGMVSRVMQLDIPFRLVTRFNFFSRETAKSRIKTLRKTYFQKRKGLGAMFGEIVTKEESQLEDVESLELAGDASEAMSLLSRGDIGFGICTSSVITRSRNYDQAKAWLDGVRTEIQDSGFVVKVETFNAASVWLGSMPGNTKYNPRESIIGTRNLAHLFPLSYPWSGNEYSKHLAEITGVRKPLMVCRSGSNLFYLNLGVGDVGHTLVIGPTGAGKSILLNTLAMQWLKYPGSRVVFFDVDRSSESSTRRVGGQFYALGGAKGGLQVSPFADVDDSSYRIWLAEFIVDFLKQRGVEVPDSEREEYVEALENMSAYPVEQRGFDTFTDTIQSKQARNALLPFVEGEFAQFFKAGKEELGTTRWTTFEMRELMNAGDGAGQFVLMYLFRRLQAMFTGEHPTLLVLDEAWLFLKHPVFVVMVRDWLKTLRKKNVYVILATQEMDDAKSSIFSTIVNACLTKILLPNPTAEEPTNSELYSSIGCTDSDIVALTNAVPKKDYFFLSPEGKQLFELSLSKKHLEILKVVPEEKKESDYE